MSTWFPWALASAVFAAVTALFVKIGVRGVDSDLATLLRTVMVAFVLGVLVWAKGGLASPGGIEGRVWVFLGLSALATGASWICYFRALQVGELSQVATVDRSSLVFAALFAVVFLGERPSLRDWCGIGLVTLGILVLAWRR